jgi:hypothetical protein
VRATRTSSSSSAARTALGVVKAGRRFFARTSPTKGRSRGTRPSACIYPSSFLHLSRSRCPAPVSADDAVLCSHRNVQHAAPSSGKACREAAAFAVASPWPHLLVHEVDLLEGHAPHCGFSAKHRLHRSLRREWVHPYARRNKRRVPQVAWAANHRGITTLKLDWQKKQLPGLCLGQACGASRIGPNSKHAPQSQRPHRIGPRPQWSPHPTESPGACAEVSRAKQQQLWA